MQVEKQVLRLALAAALCAGCAAVSLVAQGAKPYAPPKTAWGDPDLQGIWPSTDMVGVPFERPKQFGTRLSLTDEEFRQRQKDAEKQSDLDNESFSVDNVKPEIVALGDVGGVTSPPPFWLERGLPSRQSSLLVDPPDGQMPSMTPEGLRRVGADQEHVPAVHGLRRRLGTRPLRSVHLAWPARLDVPGRLQQRQPVHPDARLRRAAQRDDSRDAGDPARQPAGAVAADPDVHGRFARALRGQHARRAYDELQRRDRRAGQRQPADHERRAGAWWRSSRARPPTRSSTR